MSARLVPLRKLQGVIGKSHEGYALDVACAALHASVHVKAHSASVGVPALTPESS